MALRWVIRFWELSVDNGLSPYGGNVTFFFRVEGEAAALGNNEPLVCPRKCSWWSVSLHSIFVPFLTFDPLSAHPERTFKSRTQVRVFCALK